MKRIFCFLLSLLLLFSTFTTLAFALEAGEVVDLKEEIKTNFPHYVIDDTSDTPFLIGAMESGAESSTDEPCLYIYVYNPLFTEASYFECDFSYSYYDINGTKLGEKTNYKFSGEEGHTGTFYYNKSEDGKYLRYRLSIERSHITDSRERRYNVSNVTFWGYENEAKKQANELSSHHFDVTNVYCFSYGFDGKYTAKYNNTELVKFDVHPTTYVTNSTNERYVYDQVASVYFNIPKAYQDYYDYLYSVTSTFTKKRMTPALLTNYKTTNVDFGPAFDAAAYIRDKSFVSSSGQIDLVYQSVGLTGTLANLHIYTDLYYKNSINPNTENVIIDLRDSDFDFFNEEFENLHQLDEFPFVFEDLEADDVYDLQVSDDVLKQYISANEATKDLFCGSETYSGWTKNVNQTWDSISYSTDEVGFWDYWKEFGVGTALRWLFLKAVPEDVDRYFKANGITADGYNYYNEPYLLKVDENMRADMSELSGEDFCDKYAIGYDEYIDFVDYASKNDNVVLFRIDVDDYVSMPLNVYNSDGSVDDTYLWSLVQAYCYMDFQLLSITMNKNGEYETRAVTSDKIDIIPDLETVKPTPDVPSTDEIITGIGGYFNDKVKENPIYRILTVILVVIAVIILVWIVRTVLEFFGVLQKPVASVNTTDAKPPASVENTEKKKNA